VYLQPLPWHCIYESHFERARRSFSRRSFLCSANLQLKQRRGMGAVPLAVRYASVILRGWRPWSPSRVKSRPAPRLRTVEAPKTPVRRRHIRKPTRAKGKEAVWLAGPGATSSATWAGKDSLLVWSTVVQGVGLGAVGAYSTHWRASLEKKVGV
jgi:hypothetical protein